MPRQQASMQQRHHQPSMLQGPRPSTLKVTKAEDLQANKRRRPPVIIYVESPKVVHAHPGEFKSVVQRLTGAPPPPSASSSAPPPLQQFPFHLYGHLPPCGSSLPAADAAAGGVRSGGLGFFTSDDDQLISPAAAFLYYHHQTSMVGQAADNSLVVPPSLDGAFYHRHGGDLFVNKQLQ